MSIPNRLIVVGQVAGGFFGFDNTSTSRAPSPVRDTTLDYSGDGQSAIYAINSGASGANAFCRGHIVFDATNGPTVGDTFWWGGAFYLPVGFKAAVQGQVDLLRWDNIDQDATSSGGERCGGICLTSNLHLQLFSNATNTPLGQPNYITYHVDAGNILTEGVWHWIEAKTKVHQTDGSALNELWVNGTLIGNATGHNVLRSDWQASRLRAGIVAMDQTLQTNALSVNVDRVYAKSARLGVIPDTTPPGVPSGVTATPTVGAVDVSWTNPTDPDFTGVQVLRSTVSGGPYTQVGTDLPAPITTFHDATATPGTAYFYVVRSYDNA